MYVWGVLSVSMLRYQCSGVDAPPPPLASSRIGNPDQELTGLDTNGPGGRRMETAYVGTPSGVGDGKIGRAIFERSTPLPTSWLPYRTPAMLGLGCDKGQGRRSVAGLGVVPSSRLCDVTLARWFDRLVLRVEPQKRFGRDAAEYRVRACVGGKQLLAVASKQKRDLHPFAVGSDEPTRQASPAQQRPRKKGTERYRATSIGR